MIDQENQRIFLDEYSGDLYPLVTILIPTYNRPKLFCAALESALHQTYRNLEIFITDNSTDTRTRDIMQDYLARDPRIIYEHHPEYDCARQNWRRARSYNNPKAEYVNWLMDDDLFHPEKIATMIDAYREIDGLSLVTSYRQCIDIHGNPLPDLPTTEPICDKTSVFPGDAVGKKLLMGMDNFIGEPTTVLIKKEYLHHNDLGWSGKEGRFFISDYPTWLQLATKGNTLYIREPLSYFRQHEDQSQRKPELILRGLICIGLEIAYARETGHFLSKDEDYEHAVLNWMKSMTASLINIRNANYQMDDLPFLKEIGGNLLLDRPGEIKIPQ